MNTNSQTSSLLLVSASERRMDLQCALHETLGRPVAATGGFQEALEILGRSHYGAVVIDEGLSDLDSEGCEQFLARCTDELPIFVKLAISGVPRCLRQVQLALRRFDRELEVARESAQNALRAQIRNSVTSINLCCQIALKTVELQPEVARHIESVLQVSESLQQAVSSQMEEKAVRVTSRTSGL